MIGDDFDRVLDGVGWASHKFGEITVAIPIAMACSMLLPFWLFILPVMFVGERLFGRAAATDNGWIVASEFLTADLLGAFLMIALMGGFSRR